MHDMGRVALVRRVYGAGYRPALGILSPRIKPDYEVINNLLYLQTITNNL